MILQFLKLFRQYRELAAKCCDLCEDVARLKAALTEAKANDQTGKWRYDAALTRCEEANRRADRLEAQLIEKLSNAGDSMSLRLTGRRMFSKAPVEAPPATTERQPINLSAGSQRVFAGDVARRQTNKFFENLAKQAGVAPDDQKPN